MSLQRRVTREEILTEGGQEIPKASHVYYSTLICSCCCVINVLSYLRYSVEIYFQGTEKQRKQTNKN